MKHGRVKIDPSFETWSIPLPFNQIRKNGSILTRSCFILDKICPKNINFIILTRVGRQLTPVPSHNVQAFQLGGVDHLAVGLLLHGNGGVLFLFQ